MANSPKFVVALVLVFLDVLYPLSSLAVILRGGQGRGHGEAEGEDQGLHLVSL